ncbi:hypothetical protein MRB53_034464 [Persea americana]|uniref:Uncharacterized protein n=1 Tax=Persea americana TaxID=3435 RepID=A0ACC2K2D1_PERAE|nr:hypothetical protein MRB53_034464 [Persea americana]
MLLARIVVITCSHNDLLIASLAHLWGINEIGQWNSGGTREVFEVLYLVPAFLNVGTASELHIAGAITLHMAGGVALYIAGAIIERGIASAITELNMAGTITEPDIASTVAELGVAGIVTESVTGFFNFV